MVAKLKNTFWGVQHDDGHSTTYGFGPIERAQVSGPKFCKRPEDMTYEGSHYVEELREATLRKTVKTIIYDV